MSMNNMVPPTLAAEAQELMRQGRLAEAESAFARLLESSPAHVEALNVLALSALRRGQLPRAVELLERAVQSDPQDAVTRHHLGRALDAAGSTAPALTGRNRWSARKSSMRPWSNTPAPWKTRKKPAAG
jgi:Flp pilus assembly protein TadD